MEIILPQIMYFNKHGHNDHQNNIINNNTDSNRL